MERTSFFSELDSCDITGPYSRKCAVMVFSSAPYHREPAPNKGNRWRLPAAWKILVKNGKKLWPVTCDSKDFYGSHE